MKSILMLLSLSLLVACKSFDKEIAAITELASQWDATTQAATDFSNMLNTENANFAQLAAAVNIDSMKFGKLKAEDQAKINDARNAFTGAGTQLSQLTTDLGGLLEQWNAKTEMVNALKESLTSKQFSPTALTDVADLTTFVTESNGKLDMLKQGLEAAKTLIGQKHGDLTSLIGSLIK